MELELVNVIKEFCEMFEFKYLDGEFELVTTDDIAEYVKRDDEEYYKRGKTDITTASGLFYVDSKGENILLIDKGRNCIDQEITTIHEYVHLHDFKRYSKGYPDKSMRELQSDYVFKYWSEFHAVYISCLYLLQKHKEADIDTDSITNNIFLEAWNMKRQKRMDRSVAAYNSVYIYGEYIAMYINSSGKINAHPINFYINDKFREIYEFLFTHTTIDEFLKDYQRFEKLINSI